jgi:hypothetical protein
MIVVVWPPITRRRAAALVEGGDEARFTALVSHSRRRLTTPNAFVAEVHDHMRRC